MAARIEADPFNRGAFQVLVGDTAQSWVDPADPERLEFEYVQRVCEVLDATVLQRPPTERIRVVHLGGGGLTIPRWVAARRPHTAQIVCEPDAALIDDVRRLIPLPRQSGIKVRIVDGRSGLAAMPHDYVDALVVDAFDGARVPADLSTSEFFEDVAARCRPGGVVIANITDRAPFSWAKRFTAGLRGQFRHLIVSAEASVWKGRRFGNLVVTASTMGLPLAGLTRSAARATFPYRLLSGRDLDSWLGGAEPFSDAYATASPAPRRGTWFA